MNQRLIAFRIAGMMGGMSNEIISLSYGNGQMKRDLFLSPLGTFSFAPLEKNRINYDPLLVE